MFTRPAIDVSDEGENYRVDADLPGVPKENVEVRIGDNGRSITIEGKVVEKEEPPSHKASAKTSTSGEYVFIFCVNSISLRCICCHRF